MKEQDRNTHLYSNFREDESHMENPAIRQIIGSELQSRQMTKEY